MDYFNSILPPVWDWGWGLFTTWHGLSCVGFKEVVLARSRVPVHASMLVYACTAHSSPPPQKKKLAAMIKSAMLARLCWHWILPHSKAQNNRSTPISNEPVNLRRAAPAENPRICRCWCCASGQVCFGRQPTHLYVSFPCCTYFHMLRC